MKNWRLLVFTQNYKAGSICCATYRVYLLPDLFSCWLSRKDKEKRPFHSVGNSVVRSMLLGNKSPIVGNCSLLKWNHFQCWGGMLVPSLPTKRCWCSSQHSLFYDPKGLDEGKWLPDQMGRDTSTPICGRPTSVKRWRGDESISGVFSSWDRLSSRLLYVAGGEEKLRNLECGQVLPFQRALWSSSAVTESNVSSIRHFGAKFVINHYRKPILSPQRNQMLIVMLLWISRGPNGVISNIYDKGVVNSWLIIEYWQDFTTFVFLIFRFFSLLFQKPANWKPGPKICSVNSVVPTRGSLAQCKKLKTWPEN